MAEVDAERLKRPKTGGRQKGTPNRVTADMRQAMSALAEGNVQRVQEWLDEVAGTDPARAVELFLRLLEFVLPKLRAISVGAHADVPQSVRQMSIAELEALVSGHESVRSRTTSALDGAESASLIR